MRYTEIRLSRVGQEMLRDLNKNTVDFRPNFDDSLTEPIVLPSLFPGFVNGSSGIAVGMATSMPSYNVTEVYDACDYIIDKVLEGESVTVEEVTDIVKAPDFATGGIIYNIAETIEAMRTGKGRVIVRSKYTIEENKKSMNIVITEIPYEVNKANLIEKIHSLKEELIGFREVRDESNKDGMRIVIETRINCNINLIINTLFKKTQLQSNFSINNIALVDGRPETLNIKEIINHFLAHAASVIVRRTQFDLDRAEARAHIINGLLIAMNDIDKVIEIIRSSEDNESAINSLINAYELSEEQAKAISELRLRTLTTQSTSKLMEELDDLNGKISSWTEIINNDEVLLNTMKTELSALKDIFGDERRTEIKYDADANINIEDLIPDETFIVTFTNNGLIKNVPENEYKSQNRGGKGSKVSNMGDDDTVKSLSTVNSKDDLLFITNIGRAHKLKAYDIEKSSRIAKGKHIANYLNLDEDETVIAMVSTDLKSEDKYLLFLSKYGLIKRLSFDQVQTSRSIIKVVSFKDDDTLYDCLVVKEGEEIIATSTKGSAIRLIVDDTIRPTGRSAMGVKAINLGNETINGFIKAEDFLLTITSQGLGKRVKTEAFTAQNRAGKGVIFYKPTKKTGDVVNSLNVKEEDEILIVTKSGQMVRIKAKDVSVVGRTAAGVKLINLAPNDEVVSISRIREEDENICNLEE